MNTFKISIHPTAWEGKPKTPTEKSSLARNFNATELNLEELAQYINYGFINEKGYLNLDLFVDDKASEYNTNVKVQNSLSKEDRDAKVEPITAGSGRVGIH